MVHFFRIFLGDLLQLFLNSKILIKLQKAFIYCGQKIYMYIRDVVYKGFFCIHKVLNVHKRNKNKNVAIFFVQFTVKKNFIERTCEIFILLQRKIVYNCSVFFAI